MAHCSFGNEATIQINSDPFTGMSRCKDGCFRQIRPYISLEARFTGEWKSPEAMDEELEACIDMLRGVYQRQLKGGANHGRSKNADGAESGGRN